MVLTYLQMLPNLVFTCIPQIHPLKGVSGSVELGKLGIDRLDKPLEILLSQARWTSPCLSTTLKRNAISV